MPKHPTETGPAREGTVGAIERTRIARGFAPREFANRVTAFGRPMSNTMLSRVERTQRRCDVDDLVVLAAALGVSPLALLQPTP